MKTRIETNGYQFAHGKSPRGHGSWAFAPRFNTDALSPDILWVHQSSYADAKRAAQAHFAAKGISTAHVLS